ncbi:Protein of unknown function, partial [Gryllus bimaculatus]
NSLQTENTTYVKPMQCAQEKSGSVTMVRSTDKKNYRRSASEAVEDYMNPHYVIHQLIYSAAFRTLNPSLQKFHSVSFPDSLSAKKRMSNEYDYAHVT